MKKRFYSVYKSGVCYGIINADTKREAIRLLAERHFPEALGSREAWGDFVKSVKTSGVTKNAVRYISLCRINHEDIKHFWSFGKRGRATLSHGLKLLLNEIVNKFGPTGDEYLNAITGHDLTKLSDDEVIRMGERCDKKARQDRRAMRAFLRRYDFTKYPPYDYDVFMARVIGRYFDTLSLMS